MIRRPPRSTQSRSSAASDVYKRQLLAFGLRWAVVERIHAWSDRRPLAVAVGVHRQEPEVDLVQSDATVRFDRCPEQRDPLLGDKTVVNLHIGVVGDAPEEPAAQPARCAPGEDAIAWQLRSEPAGGKDGNRDDGEHARSEPRSQKRAVRMMTIPAIGRTGSIPCRISSTARSRSVQREASAAGVGKTSTDSDGAEKRVAARKSAAMLISTIHHALRR